MWRIGPRPPPTETTFAELNAAPVVPEVRESFGIYPRSCRVTLRRPFLSGRPRWTSGVNI